MRPASILRQMIRKDLELHRKFILFELVFGAVALAALLLRRPTAMFVAGTVFFVSLVVVGCLLIASNLLNERKKQTLAFVMSLPVSPTQFTTAKLASTLVMYLVPWLCLVLGAIWLIAVSGVLPHGAIPVILIFLTLPLVGFSLMTAMTLVGETEGWNIAANIVCNSSYGLVWYFMTQVPSLMEGLPKPHAVWNGTVLKFLGSELAFVVLILTVTYYLQSRKRDFI